MTRLPRTAVYLLIYPSIPVNKSMRLWILLGRSLRLRCCLCGQGRLFHNWFSMHPCCSHCDHVYEREPGFFLGSVYINYGLTSLVICTLYPILRFSNTISPRLLLISATIFMLAFPVWFFRYARSLWCAFDELVDPVPPTSRPAVPLEPAEPDPTVDETAP
ncbi:MAG: DUF983 domain-containing protein [Pirellulaceae bacterium]|nr:DUF983 domain-containing protein [Pirellulaceae bacterium]